MIKYVLIILCVLIGFTALNDLYATAQEPDYLVYEGKTYAIFTNPLETYFKQFPDKRPMAEISSTGLWRGYVATFEIKDNHLFIKDIKIMTKKDSGDVFNFEWKSVINNVFPDSSQRKTDWYTGVLILPQGRRIKYVHMGYESTYREYILLGIEKGRFKQKLKFNRRQLKSFKKEQFILFKKTEEYNKAVEELRKNGYSDLNLIDSILEDSLIGYISSTLNSE